MPIVGYRVVEQHEAIRDGDVAGWARKKPIDMNLWKNAMAGEFNQPVFRPMSSFVDINPDEGVDMEKSDIPVKVLTPDEANVAYAEAYQKYGADAKETEDARIAYEQALKDASDVGK
jgi:hypothetical protein